MQTVLILGTETDQKIYIDSFCQSHSISHFDKIAVTSEKSIGIEQVRTFQKHLSLKPVKSTNKVGIIHNAETLTIEAQQALLKTLEEPPQHTFLILCAKTSDVLLPTILSRCFIQYLSAQETDGQRQEKSPEEISTILTQSLSEHLSLSQTLGKEKEDTLIWIEQMLHGTRFFIQAYSKQPEQIQKRVSYQTLILVSWKLLRAHTLMQTNVSPRLVLEDILFSFPHTIL
jgi:DNA polymerase III gamma/tau subunit